MVRPGIFLSDRYEIIDKVGSGGMADVYKAKCHRLNRFVAIKILKPEYSDDKKFVEKFRAEAQSAAGLSHPNIVNVYDVGEDDGLYYIVMELVEGITLKSFIERKGKLEIKEAVGIAIQIAQGMEAAHLNHIIHRDIKPQNIIISRDGKVKVTDFGIAKAASSNTITSNAMGSVHYISPEQARGGYSDEKSDIYSLGITMYEMLSGKVPFTGDNTVSVALLHIQGEAIPLRDLEPNIPVSIDRIVQKCMQKKPERRYLLTSELIADLKKAISNPNGDFVKIMPASVTDSPTINLSSDEVMKIKSATKVPVSSNFKSVIDEDMEEDPEELFDHVSRANKSSNLASEKEEEEFIEQGDEEDDDSDVDPKLEKLVIAGGITAAIILALIIIFLVTKIMFPGSSKPGKEETPSPTITAETQIPEETDNPEETPEFTAEPTQTPEPELIKIPSLKGEKYEDAQKLLANLDLQVTIKTEESDEYGVDIVIRQSLEANTEVIPGTALEIVLSSGASTFLLTDVYGKQKTEAENILQNDNLQVIRETEFSSEVAEGMVIYTKPERGSRVSKNSSVTIVISKGPEKVSVPSLKGLPEQTAIKAIRDAGLEEDIEYAHSNDVADGLVISANYSANELVEKGTIVSITISLGPEIVDTVNYKYVARNVNISYNPFEFEDEEGQVKVVLTHGGMEEIILEETFGYNDFPIPLGNVEGIDGVTDTIGTLTMYLDGEQVGDIITIAFVRMEE